MENEGRNFEMALLSFNRSDQRKKNFAGKVTSTTVAEAGFPPKTQPLKSEVLKTTLDTIPGEKRTAAMRESKTTIGLSPRTQHMNAMRYIPKPDIRNWIARGTWNSAMYEPDTTRAGLLPVKPNLDAPMTTTVDRIAREKRSSVVPDGVSEPKKQKRDVPDLIEMKTGFGYVRPNPNATRPSVIFSTATGKPVTLPIQASFLPEKPSTSAALPREKPSTSAGLRMEKPSTSSSSSMKKPTTTTTRPADTGKLLTLS